MLSFSAPSYCEDAAQIGLLQVLTLHLELSKNTQAESLCCKWLVVPLDAMRMVLCLASYSHDGSDMYTKREYQISTNST